LQSYTRDWTATIDGQPAPILKANLYFQAVAVPAGTHQLGFTYTPSAVRVGATITVAALAILFVLCVLELVWRIAPLRRSAAMGQKAVPRAAAVP